MALPVIRWNKNYYEELGEKEPDGSYSYAYCYYIYQFSLPDSHRIRIRRYTDTLAQCSLFFETHPAERVSQLVKDDDGILAIISFMRASQGVSQFTYFRAGYEPIDLARLRDTSKAFSFVEAPEMK